MDDLKSKILKAVTEVLKLYADEKYDGPFNVAYSGGKDSTVTLAIVMRSLLMIPPERRTRKIYITSAQTFLDLTTDPTKQNEFEKIKKVIAEKNLPMEVVEVSAKDGVTILDCILGKGYPLPHSNDKWCTHKAKIEPQERFMKTKNLSMTIVGTRLSESSKRNETINEMAVEGNVFYAERLDSNGKVVRKSFQPIVHFTTEDVWSYLATEKTPWGDAEEISQLYKDATGECGLRHRKAGKDETGDSCGARFGCVICPVVTIDRSTQELSKKKPWLQPYADLRDVMIQMYKEPRNRSGHRRNGVKLAYGQGTFTVRARMELLDKFIQAQEDSRIISNYHGEEPVPILSDELIERIHQQWREDLDSKPWLEDSEELGRFFEVKLKGSKEGYQIEWNHFYDTPIESHP
jgi:DNA sulfur modification protein DndC